MNVQNPVFANALGTVINLTVDHPKFGSIPFSASPTDTELLGRDLYARAVALEFGPIAPYVAPVVTQAQINAIAAAEIRKISLNALPSLLDVMTKMATGADKAALKVFDDAVKVEKAKQVV